MESILDNFRLSPCDQLILPELPVYLTNLVFASKAPVIISWSMTVREFYGREGYIYIETILKLFMGFIEEHNIVYLSF